ncbi:MAG: MBL fold metallo-hydrolase, partial [Thermoanaerobaculia bacterium]|nr:MBL fold metallo-hydrolase [Thermoanaerobaculia bacterium]
TNAEGNFFVDSTCIDCDACRQLAPEVFARRGEMSAVVRQPETSEEELRAGKALISCPTASIGTVERTDLSAAVAALPERVEENVWRCGFNSEKSFGAFSYLIRSDRGGYLVDSPRFSRPLLRNIRRLGPVGKMLLTHSDDVADHRLWNDELECDRVMHRRDLSASTRDVELQPEGDDPLVLADDLLMIPTPGHTRGHAVFLYRSKFLFSGDHLAWSPNRNDLIAFRGVCWYDWQEQIRSMEKLLDYEFEWILPGHGRPARLEAGEMRARLGHLVDWMRSVA